MKPRHATTWETAEPGKARVSITFPRPHGQSVRVFVEASSDHHSRAIELETRDGHEWRGGLVYAAFRWTAGDGPPDLVLSWRDSPPDVRFAWRENPSPPQMSLPDPPRLDGLNYAEVSDVVLLARDSDAQWAVRAFLGILPPAGRPSERDERIAQYSSAIVALKRSGYTESAITARLILERLSRSGDDSQMRNDVGGWVAFRSKVLRGE